MARKLKVWGGLVIDGGKQFRTILATYTKKRAVELLEPFGISMYHFNDYWCETKNDIELEVGLNNPAKIFVASDSFGKDFKEYGNNNDPLMNKKMIYEKLPKKAKRDEKADVHNYEGENQSVENSLKDIEKEDRKKYVTDKDYAPTIEPSSDRQWRSWVINAAQQVKRTKGYIPDYLNVVIKNIYKPSLDWKQILQQFVTLQFGGERQWLPPNRRYVSRGLYLPSGKSSYLSVAVAVDTSSSTMYDLPFFLSELKGIIDTFGKYDVTLIECDSEIKRVRKFNEWEPFDYEDFEFEGMGGTDFRPVFSYINEEIESPKLLIYLTDGYGEAPNNPPSYPVLWVLTHDGEPPANWGWKTFLEQTELNNN